MTSSLRNALLGALFLNVFFFSISFAASPVVYTSLGAQVYLDTYKGGVLAKRIPIAQNGTSLAISNSGTPYAFSPDGKTAYIAGKNLQAIDVATGASIWQALGVYFPAIAVNADGSLLYVTVGGSTSLQIYNASTGQLLQTAVTPYGTYQQILVTPDNSRIYMSGYGVVVLDGTTYQVIATLLPALGESIALSPDGSRLYVSGGQSPYIASVVDTSSDQVVAHVSGPGLTAGALTVTPDGRKLLSENAQGLAEASTMTDQVTAFIAFSVAPTYDAATLAADNQNAYLAIAETAGFYEFDLAAGTVQHVASGGFAVSAASTPEGAVTMLQTLNTVLISNPGTKTVGGNLGSVPGNAYLVLSGDGSTVVGTSETTSSLVFSRIDTANHKVTAGPIIPITTEVVPYPAVSNDGTTAYYSTQYGVEPTEISVVDLTTGLSGGLIFLPFTYASDWGLAVSPDGSTLYASTYDYDADMTCRVSLPSYVVGPCVNSGSPGNCSRPLAFSADGTKLYEPQVGGGLNEMDAQTLALTRSLSGALPAGYTSNVIYSASTNSVYVATLNGSSSLITRVDFGKLPDRCHAAAQLPAVRSCSDSRWDGGPCGRWSFRNDHPGGNDASIFKYD